MRYGAFVLLAATMAFNAIGQEDRASVVAAQAPKPQLVPQTLCPVMDGKRIKTRRYVDYQGFRIYVCCNSCVKAVRKNPEKYLKKLQAQ